MESIISEIYRTRTVKGYIGQEYKLDYEIDQREGEFIQNIIAEDPSVLKTLKIGCAYGLSSLFICLALDDRKNAFHSIIDPYQSTRYDSVGVNNLRLAKVDYFELIENKSEFALPELLIENEGNFDFIFIDGFHTFDHTLLDCYYATRLLRVGGYLVIDDINFPSVRRVVSFLKNYPCYQEFGSVGSIIPYKWKWKKVILRTLMSPVQRRYWSNVLNPFLFWKLFGDRSITMVALKKISEDSRNSTWHVDGF